MHRIATFIYSLLMALLLFLLLTGLAIIPSVIVTGCTSHRQAVKAVTLAREQHSHTTDSLSSIISSMNADITRSRSEISTHYIRDRTATVDSSTGDTISRSSSTLILRTTLSERDRRVYTTRIDSLIRVIHIRDSLLAEKPVEIEVPYPVPCELTPWQSIRLSSWPWLCCSSLLLLILSAWLAWHRWGHLFLRRASF